VTTLKKSEKSAGQADSLDLDLPDFTGMNDVEIPVSPALAYSLLEEYWRWWQHCAKPGLPQRPERCEVEFVL